MKVQGDQKVPVHLIIIVQKHTKIDDLKMVIILVIMVSLFKIYVIWESNKFLLYKIYRVIKKSLCDEKLRVFEQSPQNWWFEDGHHRINSECGPCYTIHSLREQSSDCQ
jgi:hypothetical protein